MTYSFLRIDAPYFICGVLLRDGTVVRVAPILSYVRGWEEERFREYAARKGWKVENMGKMKLKEKSK